MTSQLVTDITTPGRSNTLLASGAVLGILGSLAFASVVVLDSDATDREAFATPTGIVGSATATLGAVLIVLALREASRTSIPATLATTGMVFTAAITWFDATAIVAIADHTTDGGFDDIGGSAWVLLFTAPKMVLCLVGFGALAIDGRRRGTMSTAASALLGVGALASVLPPFPPGLLLVSVGLLVLSRDSTARS